MGGQTHGIGVLAVAAALSVIVQKCRAGMLDKSSQSTLGGNVISSLYAAMSALLIAWLSLRVIKLRRVKKVSLGDGGELELRIAIRAQGNATEYVPISLILLALLELSGGYVALVHSGGIAMLAGRLLHARGLLTGSLHYRILGMRITIFTLIGLAFANLAYAVYSGLRAL